MLKSVKAEARNHFIGFFYGLKAVVSGFYLKVGSNGSGQHHDSFGYDLKVGSNGSGQPHGSNNNGLQAVVNHSLMGL